MKYTCSFCDTTVPAKNIRHLPRDSAFGTHSICEKCLDAYRKDETGLVAEVESYRQQFLTQQSTNIRRFKAERSK